MNCVLWPRQIPYSISTQLQVKHINSYCSTHIYAYHILKAINIAEKYLLIVQENDNLHMWSEL